MYLRFKKFKKSQTPNYRWKNNNNGTEINEMEIKYTIDKEPMTVRVHYLKR